jgi:hypothetical protein
MAAKKATQMDCECNGYHYKGGSTGNAVYGLGMIGTAYYFLQSASNFTDIVMGIVQAIFWPAILVYRALSLLSL